MAHSIPTPSVVSTSIFKKYLCHGHHHWTLSVNRQRYVPDTRIGLLSFKTVSRDIGRYYIERMDDNATKQLFTDVKTPFRNGEYGCCCCKVQLLKYQMRTGRCGCSRCRLIMSVEKAAAAKQSWINIAKASISLQPASASSWSLGGGGGARVKSICRKYKCVETSVIC